MPLAVSWVWVRGCSGCPRGTAVPFHSLQLWAVSPLVPMLDLWCWPVALSGFCGVMGILGSSGPPTLVRQDAWPGPSVSGDAGRGHRTELVWEYRSCPLCLGLLVAGAPDTFTGKWLYLACTKEFVYILAVVILPAFHDSHRLLYSLQPSVSRGPSFCRGACHSLELCSLYGLVVSVF